MPMHTQVTIIDGYTDTPALLGVPPYLSPTPRYLASVITTSGRSYRYLTIDQLRVDPQLQCHIATAQLVLIIAGAIVPGKYLRGMLISKREVLTLLTRFSDGQRVILGGKTYDHRWCTDRRFKDYDFQVASKDLDAAVWDILSTGDFIDRYRTMDEWDAWSTAPAAAELVRHHPDYPQPLIIELESSRGCVRWFTGGCSFCSEPAFGCPQFRRPSTIIKEVRALSKAGVVNFRLGGQACIFSYRAEGIGDTETPIPSPEELGQLFRGIRKHAPDLRVLHVDNANPAVIAEHPEESTQCAKILVECCTSGNVLAFGLESADPAVYRANNLNATPEQTLAAIELINRIGAERGANGLPKLLPGINFVCELRNETEESFRLNIEFLNTIMDRGLMLRRTNIRQVLIPMEKSASSTVREGSRASRSAFMRFKRDIREDFDRKMLERLVPTGTVLKDVYFEVQKGRNSFGRQIGSYPLLVGVNYKVPLNTFAAVTITTHGMRSITGITYPFNINTATLRALESLPGIGRKRAARIIRGRPFASFDEFMACLDITDVSELTLGRGEEGEELVKKTLVFG